MEKGIYWVKLNMNGDWCLAEFTGESWIQYVHNDEKWLGKPWSIGKKIEDAGFGLSSSS